MALTTNLISYWKLDDDWNDSQGTNHGSVFSLPPFQTRSGWTGKVVAFDGIDDYISANHHATLNLTDKVSMSTWVNISALLSTNTTWSMIMGKQSGGSVDGGYGLWINGDSYYGYGGAEISANFYGGSGIHVSRGFGVLIKMEV